MLACIQSRLWQSVGMTFTVTMPVALEQTMPPARARLHFAIGAFVSEEVTLGQAAEMAGISQTELMSVLAKRRIPLHYDRGDFAEDLKTISLLTTKAKHGHHQ
jgi:predicted HTH domain antitoxin